jgi:hypothetical protein
VSDELALEKVDYRLPEYRRDVFHDFYEFHLRHRAHPGCVYYLMPYLRETYDWDDEEAQWFAFLNGNTQNPITSLLLHRQSPRGLADHGRMLAWYHENYARLAFDTDRRYHKRSLEAAVDGYGKLVGRYGGQRRLWDSQAALGWDRLWMVATSIPTFGRLSAFSYLEYVRIMGVDLDCDDLMLEDRPGSRSHRNGLCIVAGLDRYDWHDSNPDFDGLYPADLLGYLAGEASLLLSEARERAAGKDWAGDVSYLTLESTLCTYKGWHRPNRRYPNVYNDMLYNRILAAQAAFPEANLDVFWEARAACLPAYLRLEDMPGDPGLAPVKQNHYRETGEVIVLGREYDRYWSSFDAAVDAGELGTFR